ncbi:AMP-binding protein [Actinoalloteichus caeruleus]|uniref:Crotonobetaine/carnitine-CoA ligase n=1 Tax=Actinoalloteichus caeruleus DSM 43889 TaxID=1120930 RepID=A0ABT1JNS8_ACTCY|nr:AMP-binding protein [Actinoalloteichus caeruleus]MCP2333796.1 crotonobetaine/carnitine-CoA ligase [Actinoalloteichus caeruleus DSM 43889]
MSELATGPGGLAAHRVPDLVTAVRRAAERWPDRVAWTFDLDPGSADPDTPRAAPVRLTFAEVDRRTAQVAAALRARGVRAGHRVAVLLRNRPEYPLVWLGLARLGAVMVPVNAKYRGVDTEHLLRTAGTHAVVTSPEFTDLLAALPATLPGLANVLLAEDLATDRGAAPVEDHQPEPEDTVNIQFTSGTTGRPKGCVLSHRYWTVLGGGMVAEFPHLGEADVLLTAQPFSYVDPQWNVVAALLAGAELVVLDGFHPSSFWSRVREHRVTYFYCLGAMPTLLLRMPPSVADRDHRVRAVQCSAIPPALHGELERRWGVPWYEAFGMTETGADIRVGAEEHDELVGTGCLGRPTRSREVRIVDSDGNPVPTGLVGELTLRGPGMMRGYLDDPEATARVIRQGWFHTGDLGRLDERGRVYHCGRLKDMVRRAGENIAAREVEEVLLTHPAVRLAAVTGVVDELRGEEVKAYLALREPDAVSPSDLAEFCASRLAAFKVPRYWEFHPDLPRTASERVTKAVLGELGGAVFDRSTGSWSP